MPQKNRGRKCPRKTGVENLSVKLIGELSMETSSNLTAVRRKAGRPKIERSAEAAGKLRAERALVKATPLSAERLREVVAYNPETGVFTWKLSIATKTKVGNECGGLTKKGYRHFCVDGKLHLAHRLVWLHVYGHWPVGEIDHKNGMKADNRLTNLRDVPNIVNQQNRKVAIVGSKSGLLGVGWYEPLNKWVAKIRANGQVHHLGYYADKHKAHQIYVWAKRLLHEGCTI